MTIMFMNLARMIGLGWTMLFGAKMKICSLANLRWQQQQRSPNCAASNHGIPLLWVQKFASDFGFSFLF
jgi:hypothetical protein